MKLYVSHFKGKIIGAEEANIEVIMKFFFENKNVNRDIMINIEDIELFYNAGSRSTNDEINKKREKIVCDLGNKNISNEWLLTNEKWNQLNNEVLKMIDTIKPEHYTKYKMMTKGGRSKHYDLELTFYNNNEVVKICRLEFKYGANEINDCPQWVSPMKPSQYFNISYEELFYDKYLPILCEKYNISIPGKEEYLKQIHNNKPPCMIKLQEKYYRGAPRSSKYTNLQEDIDNYNFAKEVNNESIKEFLNMAIFNVDGINEYFKETQKDKIYMLWNEGSFNIRERSPEEYQINNEPLSIKNNNCLCGKTKSGCDIKILLRWKNGITFPALQIS
tara:strand:- start:1455 stop:2450 length:996 start_codon:yes stop_codon:yes gene_type:complete